MGASTVLGMTLHGGAPWGSAGRGPQQPSSDTYPLPRAVLVTLPVHLPAPQVSLDGSLPSGLQRRGHEALVGEW